MPASLAELGARVAALEAERADYRAVLAAVNALGGNQREHTEQLRQLVEGQRQLAAGQADTSARVRSMDESLAEVRDLLVRALDRPE